MSDVFSLDPKGASALDEDARLNPLDPAQLPPPMWQGLDEAGKSALDFSARSGRALMTAGAVAPLAYDKLNSVRFGQPMHQAGDWYFKNVVEDVGTNAVDHWTPDAAVMGSGARVVSTVLNVTGAVPHLFANPAAFLNTSAVDPALDVVDRGGSTEAALGVGAVNLGANALGIKLPAAWGSRLVTRVATGAGANVAVGMAANAGSAAILTADGQDDQAAGYDPLNPNALLLDTLMGAAFGWHAHATAPPLSPSQRAAVLTTNNADHFKHGTMPGAPKTPEAAIAHQDDLGAAIRAILNDEPVALPRDNLDQFLRPKAAANDATASGFEAATAALWPVEGGFQKDPADKGNYRNGELVGTNFGISARAHPEVDIANLTRDGAAAIYKAKYWDKIDADALPPALQGAAFDAAVNHGVGWTKKALADAGGDPAKFIAMREARYRAIVANDPTQAKFLRGWLNRLGKFKDTNEAGRALRKRLVEDPDALVADYAKLEDSNGGTVLNTDTARELSPEYLLDRTRSADVHEAASDVVKTLYDTKLAAPTPAGLDRTVLFTAGGTGAGKTTALQDAGGAFGQPEIIYDTNMNTLASAVDKVEQALAAGREVRIAYVYRDPVEALTGGAIPRAQRQAVKFGSGRTVPLAEHAKTHSGVRPTMEALAAKYADDPRVQIATIDNSRGKGQARVAPIENLPRVEETQLRERLQAALEEARTAGLDESLYRGFSAEGRPAARMGAGDGRQPQPQNGAEVSLAARAATDTVAAYPDLMVMGEDGVARPASEILAEADAQQAQAEETVRAIEAAASCFMRTAA